RGGCARSAVAARTHARNLRGGCGTASGLCVLVSGGVSGDGWRGDGGGAGAGGVITGRWWLCLGARECRTAAACLGIPGNRRDTGFMIWEAFRVWEGFPCIAWEISQIMKLRALDAADSPGLA